MNIHRKPDPFSAMAPTLDEMIEAAESIQTIVRQIETGRMLRSATHVHENTMVLAAKIGRLAVLADAVQTASESLRPI